MGGHRGIPGQYHTRSLLIFMFKLGAWRGMEGAVGVDYDLIGLLGFCVGGMIWGCGVEGLRERNEI